MSGPLADFTGDALYLDTMVPYALLRGIDPAAQSSLLVSKQANSWPIPRS
jgi:hypothetical protein